MLLSAGSSADLPPVLGRFCLLTITTPSRQSQCKLDKPLANELIKLATCLKRAISCQIWQSLMTLKQLIFLLYFCTLWLVYNAGVLGQVKCWVAPVNRQIIVGRLMHNIFLFFGFLQITWSIEICTIILHFFQNFGKQHMHKSGNFKNLYKEFKRGREKKLFCWRQLWRANNLFSWPL